jgi:hypothetical protein
MISIIVDRTRTSARAWLSRRGEARSVAWARWLPGSLAVGVTLVALVPVATTLGPNLPLTVQPVSVPAWFDGAAEHLPSGQVLLTYPFATADSQASIPWQAIGGMHYQMAGGGGPAGTVARAGADQAGFRVLRAASVPLLAPPAVSNSNLSAVREAMRHWGVTTVVVPADPGLPAYQTARGTGYGVAFFTAVLGSAPIDEDHAWVWTDVRHRPPPRRMAVAAFNGCVVIGAQGPSTQDPWGRCVLDASGP